MATKVTELLRNVSIFKSLSDADIHKISRLLKERKYSDDQVLFRQGDKGDALYIVTHGRVKIAVNDQFGREKVLAFIPEGGIFGDMALLTGEPRAANAVASGDVRCLQLRKDDFDVLTSSNVEVMKEMLRIVAERQAATNQRVTQEASAEQGATKGMLTVVFSPRGGSGKTTLATNLAIALAQATPDRVVLLDLDVLFGHAHIMLNLQPRQSVSQASVSSLRNLDKDSFAYYTTLHEDTSLRLVVGAMRPEEGEMLTADHVRAVIDLLQKQYVHVIVDTNRSFSDANLAAIEMADRVLFVVTSELSSLRDTKECQRIFHDLLGFPRERFLFVLNHTQPYGGVPTDQVEMVLEQTLFAEIPCGGDQPARAALEGFPLVYRWPGNSASKAMLSIVEALQRTAKELMALPAGR